MQAHNKQILADETSGRNRPIELLTENGFSIIRSWEIDQAAAPTTGIFNFLVRDPKGTECEVVVRITDDLVANIATRTQQRVSLSSSFWLNCAERHLANYLWEDGRCPLGNLLWIKALDPHDVMSAVDWKSS